MEPQNYSTILKQVHGEKIVPFVFKISDTKAIQEYLGKEKIIYKIYQQLNSNRSMNTTYISGKSQQELKRITRNFPRTREKRKYI